MAESVALAADASRLASLLRSYMLRHAPRRASPSGRLDRDHRSTWPLAGP